jgi:hypothetical protein
VLPPFGRLPPETGRTPTVASEPESWLWAG